jgi:ubiquinone biosynthesis protein Coq4
VHAQVHDFWHVLFGCHTNVFGELALKALEFVQVSWIEGFARGNL